MEEDIDIEEHDLMDNPKIKSIFPDLFILKKEILDPYYEEFKKAEIHTINNSISTNSSILSSSKTITEFKSKNKENSIEESPKQIIKSASLNNVLSPTSSYFCSKIILGTKKNKEKNHKIDNQVKVVVKDITKSLEKSKRFCNTCLILFPSTQKLDEHVKINRLRLRLSDQNKEVTIKKSNVLNDMINVNNNRIQNIDTYSLKGCFHCSLVFPSQKSLIEHLYEVLGRQDTESKKDTQQPVFEPRISKNSHYIRLNTNNIIQRTITSNCDINMKYVYQCKVCSYYFNQEKFYKEHTIKKHKKKEIFSLDKVRFDSKCKFCFRDYNDVKLYNSHLLKRHKDIVLKKKFSEVDDAQIYNKQPVDSTKTDEWLESEGLQIDVLNTGVNETATGETQKYLTTQVLASDSSNKTIILSSIIFKCFKCYIHFLSSSVAINHEEHNQMLINWKCSICQNFFKRNDEDSHLRQHQHAISFTIYELCDTDFDRVLFRCSICATHCKEEDFSQHISYCKKKKVTSSYCSHCGILIDSKLKESHENNHKFKNMIESDFIMINLCKETFTKFDNNKELDSEDNQDSFIPSKRTKIKMSDGDSDSDSKPLSLAVKRSKNNKTNIRSINYMNVALDSDSDPDFKLDASESSDANNTSYDSDSEIELKLRNFKHSKRSKCNKLPQFDTKALSTKFKTKKINQLQLLNLTYCYFCQCFISRICKLDVHLESRCTHILKRVCTYCGLTIKAKCIYAHQNFHVLNPNLKLQDFQFYDIKTNEVMCPPIPKYPKCDYCDKHAISKVEIKSHSCVENDFVLCNICNIKLSNKAYKLHSNFHTYSLRDNENNVLVQNDEENSKTSKTDSPMPSSNSESNDVSSLI